MGPNSYWDYIRVDDLLALQSGVERDETQLSNDEVMFIIVHQVDELWLKLVLRELVAVRDLFSQDRVPEQALASAVRGIRRVALLFKKIGDHFELMETLTTRSYLSFRGKLYPASGFQSAQMREIEVILGLKDEDRHPLGHEKSFLRALKNHDGSASTASARVERRLNDTPSLHEAVMAWLSRTPIDGSTPDAPDDEARVSEFVEKYLELTEAELRKLQGFAQQFATNDEDRERLKQRYDREIEKTRAYLLAEEEAPEDRDRLSRVRAALIFIESYRELPLLAWPREVVDALIEMEQSMVMFRQRHARAVERIIGRRTGTGGSAGVEYLEKTADYRVFKELWATRTILLPRDALADVTQPEAYGLAPGV